MNTWLFSKDNQTFGPFTGTEAKDFAINNSFAYAWKPSFTHWMPVTSIEDFSSFIPAPEPPIVIPQELLAAFYEREKSLVEQLSVLDKRIALTNHSLVEFNKEITQYKRLTKSCNLEMQDVLDNIESQYARLKENLVNFSNNALSDKAQVSKTVEEFNDCIARNSAEHHESTKVNNLATGQLACAIHPVENVESIEPVNDDTAYESELLQEVNLEALNEQQILPEDTATTLSVVELNADLTSSANEYSSVKPVSSQSTKVEYSEEVSAEDVYLSSRMRRVQMDPGKTTISYDKTPVKQDYAGSFDYILKGEYSDDGLVGTRVNKTTAPENEMVAAAEEAEEVVKKRRRRRRR